VVVVVQVMILHRLLVVVEVLHLQLLLHMLVLDMVHIIQIQELLEKVLKLTVDLVEVLVGLLVAPLLRVVRVVQVSFLSHILPK
jgi:hypothetical protein